jgi:hypothetical protein
LEFQPDSASSTAVLYFYNNTLDASSVGHGVCKVSFNGSSPAWRGTANFQNNHIIGSGGTALSAFVACQSGATCTNNDNGSEIYQSEAVANGQGYLSGNDYAPTLPTGNATVGAGANLASLCATFSSDNALCSGTGLGVVEKAGQGGYVAVSPAVTPVPRPSTGLWDVGAYQFAGSGSGQPNPPSGLTAVVQ